MLTAEEKKQRAREAHRKWREANPEKCREKAREASRKWRQENPEKVKEQRFRAKLRRCCVAVETVVAEAKKS